MVASLPDHLRSNPVGRHRLPRAVMEEHQRSRVVEAAIAVFAEQGYPATTVDDLVAAARMGVGSFYSLFGGKEECLLAAYDRILDEVRPILVEAAAAAGSWEAQLCLGLRALLEWTASEPARARVALVEVQTGGPAPLARYEETLAGAAEFLALGRAGREALALPESQERTAVSGVAWLLQGRLVLDEADSIPALFEEVGALLLEPYLGVEAARATVAEVRPVAERDLEHSRS
jgi:AcrR family transcriptional regulator